jgi:hypothetical protein
MADDGVMIRGAAHVESEPITTEFECSVEGGYCVFRWFAGQAQTAVAEEQRTRHGGIL